MITHIRDDEIGPSQENSTGDGVNQAVNSLDAQNPAPPPIPTQGSSDVSRTASRLRRAAEALRWFLLDQWFLVVFCILILISSQVQVASSQESLKGTVIDYLAVAIIFFINGCTLPTKVLLKSVLRWKVQIYSQLQSYLMTSAIVFGIVSACASNPDFMDPALLVGLIIWGCLPTTISSNVIMTTKSHGNTALTIAQSTIGNLLGPFLSPILIKMYTSTGAWYTKILPTSNGGYGEIYRRVFKQLGFSMFLPLFVGQIMHNLFPSATKKVFTEWKLSKLASLSLLTLLWSTFDLAFGSGAFQDLKASNMIFIVFISIALFLLWLAICVLTSMPWLDKKDVISIAFCVPAKTPAMGVPLTAVMFTDISTSTSAKMRIPMIIFQAFLISISSLLTIPFRAWVRADEERAEKDRSATLSSPAESGEAREADGIQS